MNPPKDILALGQHLVDELGFSDGGNTLGRWMAHHVAELMIRVKNSSSDTEREAAHTHMVETILKIWEHRSSLPGKAYPLKSYENVLLVLDRLRPDSNPFPRLAYYLGTEQDRYAAILFDNFSRLVIALLLMNVESSDRDLDVDSSVKASLSEPEQYLVASLQEWLLLLQSAPTDDGETQGTEEPSAEPRKIVDLDALTLQLIDDLTENLAELRSKIGKNANN